MYILWGFLLGLALAMDAFSVSITNRISEPNMKKLKINLIALTYAIFQGVMPLLGYLFSTIFENMEWFRYAVPFIAIAILLFLGIKALVEGIKNNDEEVVEKKVTIVLLLIQAVATSIDALSVGIGLEKTLSADFSYQVYIGIGIIVIVTFIVCLFGLLFGRIIKDKLQNKANIIAGVILIAIAVKILVQFLIETFAR